MLFTVFYLVTPYHSYGDENQPKPTVDQPKSEPAQTKSETAPPQIEYKTKSFILQMGAVILNPYTIKKDQNGNFMLAESGETDTRFFVEALVKQRNAWLEYKLCQWCFDGEVRLGLNSTDKDASGAVVAGGGDAYMEINVGFRLSDYLSQQKKLKDYLRQGGEQKQFLGKTNVFYSFNFPELIAGFVTDKGSQDIHVYYGGGAVAVFGIPYYDVDNYDVDKKSRIIEFLAGTYAGAVELPRLIGDTREVKKKNDFPDFEYKFAAIWRGDIRFPIGENGFFTVNGRFYTFTDTINPWTVSLGYTIPIDKVYDSIKNLINQ